MSNILFMDVETTGLNPEIDSVIQIAAQYYKGEERISQFETKLKPYKNNLSLGALMTNKVSPNDLNLAQDSKTACNDFIEYLQSIPDFTFYNKIVPAAHNAAFDISFLKSFLKAHNVVGWDDFFSYRVVDTAAIARFLVDVNLLDTKSVSLGILAKSLKIEVDETKQHEALYDTELCAKVYFAMKKLITGDVSQDHSRNWL